MHVSCSPWSASPHCFPPEVSAPLAGASFLVVCALALQESPLPYYVNLLGLPYQGTGDWVAEIIEIYCLTVVESRSLRLRCLSGLVSTEASWLGLQVACFLSIFPWSSFWPISVPSVPRSPLLKRQWHTGLGSFNFTSLKALVTNTVTFWGTGS